MTIPDWLQAIQSYMKMLQYPSSRGGAPQTRGAVVMASLAACLLLAGHPKVSRVGEDRCWKDTFG